MGINKRIWSGTYLLAALVMIAWSQRIDHIPHPRYIEKSRVRIAIRT